MKKFICYISFLLPSFATVLLFRIFGFKVGKNCKLPLFSLISANKIFIGNDVDIRRFVFINVAEIYIGDNSFISYFSFIRGNGKLIMKGNSGIGMQTLIHCDADIEIGYYSGFGVRNTVYSHSSFLPANKGYITKKEKIVLEDFVWIGANVCCFAGTYVEENSIVSPGLVLNSRVKGNSLVSNNASILKYYKLPFNRYKKAKINFYIELFRKFALMNNYHIEYNEMNNEFIINAKHTFKINLEKEIVTLFIDSLMCEYDLNNFTVTYLKNNLHKKFLSFIKRDYGIFLQTKY
ncbi:MAG: hypothetical protein NTY74_10940 [Ignavibacteriae bacterium]|nr:hypothetical protein [Ignavibacteriota bacterium]